MRQWAIVVGLNHYQHIQPLSCAQQDAQVVHQYLIDELGFQPERCLLLTDASPSVWGKPTQPTRVNLLSWIELLAKSYLHPDDLFWFFFSGHGIVHEGKDYLMPVDGNPADIPSTCIPVAAILQRLKSVLTDSSMLVLLDISRSQGMSSPDQNMGIQTAQMAYPMGVPTILSARPGQISREVSSLGHGLFTIALLEGLRYQPGTTIAALTQFLGDRLPELCEYYWQPIYKPLLICPLEQMHRPVLPAAPDALPATTLNGSPSATVQLPLTPGSTQATAAPQVVTLPAPAQTAPSPQSPYTTTPIGKVPASGQPTVLQADTVTTTQFRPARPVPDSLAPTRPPVEGTLYSVPTPPAARSSPGTPKPEEDIKPGQLRSVWLWGSVISLLLAAGVLGRNWASLSSPEQLVASASNSVGRATPTTIPNPPATSTQTPTESTPLPPTTPLNVLPPVTSNPPASPDPVAPSPVPSPVLPPAPSLDFNPPEAQLSGQVILDRARKMVQSDQATPYHDAINEARKISPEEAIYPNAQAAIQEWSQTIFEIAQRRAIQQQMDIAVLAADKVPQDSTALYPQARALIAQWCPSVRALPGDTDSQVQAKAICNSQ